MWLWCRAEKGHKTGKDLMGPFLCLAPESPDAFVLMCCPFFARAFLRRAFLPGSLNRHIAAQIRIPLAVGLDSRGWCIVWPVVVNHGGRGGVIGPTPVVAVVVDRIVNQPADNPRHDSGTEPVIVVATPMVISASMVIAPTVIAAAPMVTPTPMITPTAVMLGKCRGRAPKGSQGKGDSGKTGLQLRFHGNLLG
jgi:hypothetical protein